MPNHTGVSPQDPNKYLGPNVYLTLCVTRNREPTGADYRQPETGKLYPFNSFWLVAKNPTTGTQGDLWYLSKIAANVAFWVKLGTSGGGPILSVDVDAHTAPGTDPVLPDVNGLMHVTGGQVASGVVGTNVIRTNSLALNTYTVEIQRSAESAAPDLTLNGVSHFNSAHFDVDADGFVSLFGGGAAVDSVTVQAAFAPGVNPVVPNAGNIILNGTLVAAGTTPIQSTTRAVNTAAIEVQISQAVASTDITRNGMSHYDSKDFIVDANGFVSAKGSFLTPGVQNIGFTYAAGIFTITAANGTALSATNKGYLVLESNATPGTFVQYTFTAPMTFQDNSGSSTLAGNTWGFDSGTNVAFDVPFFLYGVSKSDDTAATFMITRYPNSYKSITAGSIAQSGSALASTQASFYSLTAITAANYASTAALSVGSFRMQKVGAGANDWQVVTLTTQDGIGRFQDGMLFSIPQGHFGASANSYFKPNGGTAPVYSTNGYAYALNRSNYFSLSLGLSTNTTPALGAVDVQLVTPFSILNRPITSWGNFTNGSIFSQIQGSAITVQQFTTFSFVNDTASGPLTLTALDSFAFSLEGFMQINFV